MWAFFNDAHAEWNGVESGDYSNEDGLEAKLIDYVSYNKKIYSDEITLPIPSKEGATFKGWYLNPEFTGEAVTTVSSSCKLYAKWE